ncbi:MAG: dephospho-CoA kinase [Ilumatobacteraceae bacterium]|jgi:dephospho-CoA kinase|nr:dephospho-CoA kinase [Actinomycetes bacterium]
MILVGLTGGIGAGKSAVSLQLASHGAIVIDADVIVRELQLPGQQVFADIVQRFGPEVVAPSGHLDRAALAARVFGDAEALADLNRIVHPAVGREMMRRIDDQRSTTNVVVLDVPLLVENPRTGLCGTVVVDLDPEVAVERLVAQRGYTEEEARSRIARQASRKARRSVADWIIDNSGSRLDLARQVGLAWRWMCSLPPADADAGRVVTASDS